VVAVRATEHASSRLSRELHALIAHQPWPADYAGLVEQALLPHPFADGMRPGISRWAALVLACASACGHRGEAAEQTAVAAALMMAALNVFDDAEDGELAPGVTAEVLVNVGTGLLLLFHQVCATPSLRELPAPGLAVLVEAALRACGGQHRDLSTAADAETMTPEAAVAISAAKSASLVVALCRVGALAGGARGLLLARYAAFGHHLGMAAQLANDLAAVQEVAGTKADRVRRRPTLPLVYAVQRPRDLCEGAESGIAEEALMVTWVVAQTHRLRALSVLDAIERAQCGARAWLEPFLPEMTGTHDPG